MGKMESSSKRIPMDMIPGIFPDEEINNEPMYINTRS
jgi:hypothetical protein